MKKFITILLLFTSFFTVISCSDDDENLNEKENVVECIVTTDDPCAKLRVDGTTLCTGSYYEKIRTKGYYAQRTVECDDPYVNITIQFRVNGKTKAENKGTKWVQLTYKIK